MFIQRTVPFCLILSVWTVHAGCPSRFKVGPVFEMNRSLQWHGGFTSLFYLISWWNRLQKWLLDNRFDHFLFSRQIGVNFPSAFNIKGFKHEENKNVLIYETRNWVFAIDSNFSNTYIIATWLFNLLTLDYLIQRHWIPKIYRIRKSEFVEMSLML